MGFCEALEPKDDPPEDLDRTDEGFRCIFNNCCRSNGGAVEERTARVKVPVPSELLVPSGEELILMIKRFVYIVLAYQRIHFCT